MCLLLSVWPQPNLKQLSASATSQHDCGYSQGCVMSTSMSFFWNRDSTQCPGGRKWTVRLSGRRQLTDALLLVATGAVWGLRLDRRVMSLVIVSFTDYSRATSRGWAAFWFGLKKTGNRVLCFHSPTSFILFLFSRLRTRVFWWRLSWWAGHRDHVSSHGKGWSAHCSGEVM